jgi:hypothetical protein
MLYYYVQDENTIITHDGNSQLGVFNNVDLLKNNELYIEVHWVPDIYINRYKRINFQRHLAEQAKLPKEQKDDDILKVHR